jgi:hypothetical protein
MPGTPDAILGSLNRTWTDDGGSTFDVQTNTLPLSLDDVTLSLANDAPLIIGTLGHAMILTALTVDQDATGRYLPIAATVRDPWPFSPGRRVLSPQEWYNIQFAAVIGVA